jgi:hypothetical protein
MLNLRIKTPSATLSMPLAPSTKVNKLKELLSEKEGVQTPVIKVKRLSLRFFVSLCVMRAELLLRPDHFRRQGA